MPALMRCLYCGLLQDEPPGVKVCAHCGGELVFEQEPPPDTYLHAHMELDQITAPADRVIDRHLIVAVKTPAQVPTGESAPTETGRGPLSFVAVLDVSGSMRGDKLTAVKEAVRQAVQRLHDEDIFSLVTFSNRARTVLQPTRVNRRLRRQAESLLREIRAGGMTALDDGLRLGLAAARSGRQETNLVLLLGDGQANVGETDLEKIGRRAFEARRQRVTVSTLGVGRDYNEALMVEIANQGGGRFYHILRADQIVPYVAGELGEVGMPAAKEVVLHLTLPSGTGVQPFSTAYLVAGQSRIILGDIPLDTRVEVALRLLLPPQPEGTRLSITGELTYRSPAGHELTTPLNRVTLHFVAPAGFTLNAGAVRPVVERVLEQMKARNVLQTSRALAVGGPEAADRQVTREVEELRAYAARLGDEVAGQVVTEHEQEIRAMTRDRATAKKRVSTAFSTHRATKTFG